MSSFKEAFEKGLQAADKAKSDRAEIRAIVEEASSEVSLATAGQICIRQEKRYRPGTLASVAAAAFPALVSDETPPPVNTLVAIRIGSGGKELRKEELCEFNIGAYGYPVGIKWSQQFYSLEDKNAVRVAISTLLSHPDTGLLVQRLLKMKDPDAAPAT